MDEKEAQAVMKYVQKKDMTSKEIHEDQINIFADDFSSYATEKKWAVEFKQSSENTEDNLWSGYPKTSKADEQVDAIHCMF